MDPMKVAEGFVAALTITAASLHIFRSLIAPWVRKRYGKFLGIEEPRQRVTAEVLVHTTEELGLDGRVKRRNRWMKRKTTRS